jgi:hypothetical protein
MVEHKVPVLVERRRRHNRHINVRYVGAWRIPFARLNAETGSTRYYNHHGGRMKFEVVGDFSPQIVIIVATENGGRPGRDMFANSVDGRHPHKICFKCVNPTLMILFIHRSLTVAEC